MISIIICSKYKVLQPSLLDNIAKTIVVEYEIISIDNSENKYSIYEAYNIGWKKSKFPYLCFVHEDVKFHTQNWGEKIINHLQIPTTGICGIAGRDLLTRVPASWNKNLSGANIIQSYAGTSKKSKRRLVPAGYCANTRSVVSLDGVILCMRRELMTNIGFDEQFNGFHGYDFDICIQSIVKGYTNYVMYDVLLEHFSAGNPDGNYYSTLIKVFKKWQNELPLTSNKSTLKQTILNEEVKAIYKLYTKLKRRGFKSDNIQVELDYFIKKIDPFNKKIILLPLRLKWAHLKS